MYNSVVISIIGLAYFSDNVVLRPEVKLSSLLAYPYFAFFDILFVIYIIGRPGRRLSRDVCGFAPAAAMICGGPGGRVGAWARKNKYRGEPWFFRKIRYNSI